MIYRKDDYYTKLNNFKKNNFEVVTDFDRTITGSNGLTTWGILNESDILPKEYAFERNSLYNYYRPIELDVDIDEAVKIGAMEDWYNKHLDLLKKYSLSRDNIIDLFSNKEIMEFRKGFVEFYNYLDSLNIRFNIISSGIGDFVLKFLEINNCSFVNLTVTSNFLNFDRNGYVIGFRDSLIHNLNKHNFSLEKTNKDYVLLIGDQVSDVMMVDGFERDHVLSVAYVPEDNMKELEVFRDVFDIVLTGNEGFDVLLKDLKSVIEK